MITEFSRPVTIGGLVPALPSSILESLWVQVSALLPARQDTHPLGCHRRRIPDRVVFDKLIQVLVFGCGYHRIADHTCSATTLRRRRDEWIALGLAEQLRLLVLAAYDQPAALLAALDVDRGELLVNTAEVTAALDALVGWPDATGSSWPVSRSARPASKTPTWP
jgi:transposase